MPDPGRSTIVTREVRLARQAMDDAERARDAGLSDRAVINRLYYAAFHAVQAALYDRGFEPGSHGGVRSLFGSEIIAAGEAPREDGRFLSRLSELRQLADYGYDGPDEDIDALLERTRRLVSDMDDIRSDGD
jgi:uncharacterized protein (UPF0332 family)